MPGQVFVTFFKAVSRLITLEGFKSSLARERARYTSISSPTSLDVRPQGTQPLDFLHLIGQAQLGHGENGCVQVDPFLLAPAGEPPVACPAMFMSQESSRAGRFPHVFGGGRAVKISSVSR